MKKLIYNIVLSIYRFFIIIFRSIPLKENKDKVRERIYNKYFPNELWSDSDFYRVERNIKYDLSLIVPVYNTEKYLEKCIESLINQKTRYNYEIICINDGSTDKSLEILERYKKKNKNIKVISQKNGGLSVARNTGINCSNGIYVGFVDSDDYISNKYVETLLKKAYERNADMVKTGYFEFNSDSYDVIKKISFKEDSINISNEKNKIENIKGHAWGSVIRKCIFDNVRFPVGYWYEDMIMKFLVIPQCKKIEVINENLYYYRITPTGLSRNVQKAKSYKCLEQYFLLEKILEKYNELKLPIEEYLYKSILHELGTMLWLRTRNLEKNTRKDIFILACDLLNKYDVESNNINFKFNQKYIKKSLERRDFYLWKLISIYCMIEIKYL